MIFTVLSVCITLTYNRETVKSSSYSTYGNVKGVIANSADYCILMCFVYLTTISRGYSMMGNRGACITWHILYPCVSLSLSQMEVPSVFFHGLVSVRHTQNSLLSQIGTPPFSLTCIERHTTQSYC